MKMKVIRSYSPDYYLIFRILLLFSVILVLFSCLGDNNKNKTILTFSIWGTPQQANVEKKIIHMFEKENPNIRVKLTHISTRDYHRKIISMYAADTLPDVIMVNGWLLSEYAHRQLLLDLNPMIERDNYNMDQFFEFAKSSFSYKGKVYGLPRDISGRVMFYNKDILKLADVDVPKDWEEFRLACRMISEKLNRNPENKTYYGAVPWEIFFNILWGMGGDVFDDPDNPTRSTLNSKAALKALQYLSELHETGVVASPTMYSVKGPVNLFAEGNTGFYFGGRWVTPDFKLRPDFNWDVAEIPRGPGGAYCITAGTCYSISSRTKHKEEAWKFLQFYAGEKGSKMAMKGGRTTPALRDIVNSDYYTSLEPDKNMQTFIWSMNNGRRWCRTPERSQYEAILFRNLELLQLGLASPVQVQKKMYDGLTKVLKNK